MKKLILGLAATSLCALAVPPVFASPPSGDIDGICTDIVGKSLEFSSKVILDERVLLACRPILEKAWNLETGQVKGLVDYYNGSPQNKESVVNFVAAKLLRLSFLSNGSNGYKPLRQEIANHYKPAKKLLSAEDFSTFQTILHDGTKLAIDINGGDYPDFIYNWLKQY